MGDFPIRKQTIQKIFRNRAFYFPQINFTLCIRLMLFVYLSSLASLCLFVITKDKFSQRKAKGQPGTLSQFVRYVRVNIGREIRNLRGRSLNCSSQILLLLQKRGKNSAEEPPAHKMSWVRKTVIGILLLRRLGSLFSFVLLSSPSAWKSKIIFLSILWVSALLLSKLRQD